MGKPLYNLPVTEVTVPDGGTTATQALGNNSGREHLLCPWQGTDFYLGYGVEPTGTADQIKAAMMLVDNTPYGGDFWDTGGIPRGPVWLYQDAGGGDLTVKVREGN